jgi:hypothetical protein
MLCIIIIIIIIIEIQAFIVFFLFFSKYTFFCLLYFFNIRPPVRGIYQTFFFGDFSPSQGNVALYSKSYLRERERERERERGWEWN